MLPGGRSYLRQPARPVFLQNIVESPVLHIDRKHIVIDQAAAKSTLSIRLRNQRRKSFQQVLPQHGGDVMSFGRVHVSEKNQSPQQHLPMLTNVLKDAPPIQVARGCINDVDDVRSIKALTPRHKKFGHEQLLRRQNSAFYPQDRCGLCVANPCVVHDDYTITHAGDEIHEIVIAMYLGEPYGIADFTIESLALQISKGSPPVLRGQKNIQIFGGPAYAGVL